MVYQYYIFLKKSLRQVAGGLSRPEGEMVDFTLRTAERFDCRRGRWAALPPMAEARQGCSCAAVAGGRVAVVQVELIAAECEPAAAL